MDRSALAASVLMAAIGLVAAATELPAQAQETQLSPGANPAVVQQNMLRAQQEHLARCYGVNAAAGEQRTDGACLRRASDESGRSQILRAAAERRLRQGLRRVGMVERITVTAVQSAPCSSSSAAGVACGGSARPPRRLPVPRFASASNATADL